jgi:hypothetical protein
MAREMQKNRATWIVADLVTLHCVLHVAAISAISRGMPPVLTLSPSDLVMYSLFMLGPSQGILLGFWIAFGGGQFLWRAIPTALGGILYVWCFSRTHDGWLQEWLKFSLAAVAVSLAVLLAARCTGLRLTRQSDRTAAAGPFQFYIRDMLAWTTAVAVVLGTWRCLPADALGFLQRSIPGVAFISVPLVAIVSMFSALREGRLLFGTVLLPLTIVLGAKLMYVIINERSWWYFVFLLSSVAFWLIGSFLVLRFTGYRLAWRPSLTEPQAPTL